MSSITEVVAQTSTKKSYNCDPRQKATRGLPKASKERVIEVKRQRPCPGLGLPRLRMPRGKTRCDFCGEEPIVRLIACHNFGWEGRSIFFQPVGWWAACEVCTRLIGAAEWEHLNARVYKQASKRPNITKKELEALRKDLRELHRLLRENIMPREALEVLTSKVHHFFAEASPPS